MKNGYFQLICSETGVAAKIVAPEDGGSMVQIREFLDYLNQHGIEYETAALNKGLQDALMSQKKEYAFQVNRKPATEIDESYQLIISQDNMSVIARFYPPSYRGKRITMDDLMQDLTIRKITFGIQEEELKAFFKNPVYCTDVTVALGQEPVHGSDARIEYYFETDLKAKPTLNSDGSVDFFHLNTINHCSEGDVLARLFLEDPGQPGYTVFNERIKPRDVKRAFLRYGRNIAISEDKLVLTAETNGHVTLVDDKVFVSNIFEVENVDISTGDIEYDGSVVVNGNVCTNFTVKAKGNIEVRGIVEGAVLEAGGDIIIARGMNGMARGILKAGGNVIAKFLESAKVTAGGYVSTESILHSNVMAGSEITVSGKRGFVTGGKVSATNLVRVKTLGSAMGADTIVEVGMDPGAKLKVQQLQKQIVESRGVLEKIAPVRTALMQKMAQGVKLAPDQVKNLQDMIQKEGLIKKQIDDDMKELTVLTEMMNESASAHVEVTGEVFAGTKICIADVSMVVKSSMSYCRFIKEHGDVKMTAL